MGYHQVHQVQPGTLRRDGTEQKIKPGGESAFFQFPQGPRVPASSTFGKCVATKLISAKPTVSFDTALKEFLEDGFEGRTLQC